MTQPVNDGPWPNTSTNAVAQPEGVFTTQPTVNSPHGPFLPFPVVTVLGIAPASGPHTGGTPVVINVSDSESCVSAAVGGIALTAFTIIDHTHVGGTTATGMAIGANDVTVVNNSGTGTGTGLFTGT